MGKWLAGLGGLLLRQPAAFWDTPKRWKDPSVGLGWYTHKSHLQQGLRLLVEV